MVILDFHIKTCQEKRYSLEIFERPKLKPLVNSFFDYDLSYMTEFEIRQLTSANKDPYARIEGIQAFGTKLFNQVFTPEVHTLWRAYKEKSDFLVL